MDISPNMQSLLEKLDALELTEGERTAFGQLLLGDEPEEEVERFLVPHTITRVQGFNLGVILEKNVVLGKGPLPRNISTGASATPED